MTADRKTYFVRFGATSALKLERPRKFVLPGVSMLVGDALRESSGSSEPEHSGLLFSVELEASDLVSAIQQSELQIAPIADLLAMTHVTAIGDPVFLFALDLEPMKTDRQFAQGINNAPVLNEVRRSFSDDVFRPLFDLLKAVRAEDTSHKKHKIEPRLVRALHYLRRSYLETDPLDRFEDLTAALQSLDTLIRRKHNLPTKYDAKCKACREPLRCAKCKTQFEREENWSGTDYVITNILKHCVTDARQLRGKRNDVAHALKQVPELLDNLEELTDLAHKSALAGLLDVLGAADPKATLPILPLLTNSQFIVTATLHNIPVKQIRSQEKYPQLKLVEVQVGRPVSAGREIFSFASLDMIADNFDGDWTCGSVYSRLPKYPKPAVPEPSTIVQKLRRP